jgi:hypothetical protein
MTAPTRHHQHMAWSNRGPRAAKYGRDHQAQRAAAMAALKAAGAGLCAEPICVMRSRIITPDMQLHLSHAPDGITVLGLSHRRCNTREAAVRGNRLRYHPERVHTQRSKLTW